MTATRKYLPHILILLTFALHAPLYACSARASTSCALQSRLQEYISGKNARIGVAVIYDQDTISVNGHDEFPMMSVFKFPLALAVAQWAETNGVVLSDSISFGPDALRRDTYSPMLDKYGPSLQSLSIQELLKWSLMESDNNAADIILHLIGGPEAATNLMKQAGCPEAITIGASENDLHSRPDLILLNKATPIAMAALFHRFNTEIRHRSSSFAEIAAMLEQCRTGADRLAMPLSHAKAVIGHKTGTGFTTPLGGITALNDCGYVNLPNGIHYSIAVFIADSPYSTQATAKIIAGISSIVLSVLSPSSTQNRNL